MNDSELKYWLAFSEINRLGPKRFSFMRQNFPNLEIAWKASPLDLLNAGLNEKIIEEMVILRCDIDPNALLEKIKAADVSVVTITDPAYPKLLKEIYNPPFVLYYKGNLAAANEQTIAVVGTRKFTHYGKNVTTQIVAELAKQNFCIVSGLAIGIDSLAHLAALKNGQHTIAVLASGLDDENIYPSINRSLLKDILKGGGLVVSEYPLGRPPLRHNFPARNRIISGLSLGTLIVEAGETSGSLITASFSLEQNREVFAIPGALDSPCSVGTNELIKRGAKMVTNVNDILEELNIKKINELEKREDAIPDTPEEATLLKYLAAAPLHINDLVAITELTITEVSATLMLLEMKGKARNLGNMVYCRNK